MTSIKHGPAGKSAARETASEVSPVSRSLTGNSAQVGGGIFNDYDGALTISDSSIAGNSAADDGGIYNTGVLTLRDSTILGNVAPVGADVYNAGQLFVDDSIIGVLYPGLQSPEGGQRPVRRTQ